MEHSFAYLEFQCDWGKLLRVTAKGGVERVERLQ